MKPGIIKPFECGGGLGAAIYQVADREEPILMGVKMQTLKFPCQQAVGAVYIADHIVFADQILLKAFYLHGINAVRKS